MVVHHIKTKRHSFLTFCLFRVFLFLNLGSHLYLTFFMCECGDVSNIYCPHYSGPSKHGKKAKGKQWWINHHFWAYLDQKTRKGIFCWSSNNMAETGINTVKWEKKTRVLFCSKQQINATCLHLYMGHPISKKLKKKVLNSMWIHSLRKYIDTFFFKQMQTGVVALIALFVYIPYIFISVWVVSWHCY